MVDLSNIEVATCIRCDAVNYKTESHSHDQHAMMLLPVSSTMTVNDEHYGMRRLLERDYFYYVEAGLPHDTWANRSYQEHIAVYLNRDWQRFLYKRHGLQTRSDHASGIWALSDTSLHLAKIIARKHSGIEADHFDHSTRLVELMAEDCLVKMLTSKPELRGHPGEHGAAIVREAIAILRASLVSPPSLDELAAGLDISRRHLTRLFRERTGLSVSQFVRAERHREAARLVRETEWSIQQIASHVGLDNAANFTTSFKREHGMTPSDFRLQARLARLQS